MNTNNMQLFSYVIDVLVSEAVVYYFMDVLDVDYAKVSILQGL